MKCVGVSARGQRSRCPFRTRTSNEPRSDVSSAVPVTSPSPCMPWPSPTDNRPPWTCTGRYSVDPATRSLLSRFPTVPAGRAGSKFVPTSGGGATPIEPKKWRERQRTSPRRELDTGSAAGLPAQQTANARMETRLE